MKESKGTNTKKRTSKSYKVKKPPSKQSPTKRDASGYENGILSVVGFFISILLFFLVVIPGENLWFHLHKFILGLFGIGSIVIPVALGYVSWMVAMEKKARYKGMSTGLLVFLILLICSLFYVFSIPLSEGQTSNWFSYVWECYRASKLDFGSGLLGGLLGAMLIWAFGTIGARITDLLIAVLCSLILTQTSLIQFFAIISRPFLVIKEKIGKLKFKENSEAKFNEIPHTSTIQESKFEKPKEDMAKVPAVESKSVVEDISKVTEKFLSRVKNNKIESEATSESEESSKAKEFECPKKQSSEGEEYIFPSVELLNKPVVPKEEDISTELNSNGQILVDTLKSFNVQTRIVDISRGPAVTRYELQPASGVKISKITTLSDDIALNLAASGVRIEAPIPGKAAVGIEIPNKVISMVGVRELITSPEFKNAKSKLTVVLGRDISGEVTVADLAKMPHLLIAGSTGSGKSVCINSFIISLLYNSSPSEVKLLMIDPKVVELGIYNGIPHLLVPVVTDARKAAGALGWAVNEMIERYKRFAENNVRDISSYNEFVENSPGVMGKDGEVLEKIPQIVIIIDELSDLMMVAPNDVEDYICRLAQMARAAGMYLVIATQRPSVDVITGIIKANIPSRIALAVSSQIDSRTILDMSGAEKLLGRGDMLFSPAGSSKPIRVQGCYVTDKEIEKVIKFIKTSQNSNYDDSIVDEIEKNSIKENIGTEKTSDNDIDPMMKEAIKCVVEAGQASTSLLQRRLRVGYARAGRLVDEMEQMGIVGPHEGSKPRQVLINYQQFLEMNMNKSDVN